MIKDLCRPQTGSTVPPFPGSGYKYTLDRLMGVFIREDSCQWRIVQQDSFAGYPDWPWTFDAAISPKIMVIFLYTNQDLHLMSKI